MKEEKDSSLTEAVSVQTGWKRPFFTIAVGQAVSLIGSSAVQFALIWWLASETSSPMMLAFSGLMAFLPQAILGPFAGVWIDRMKRKQVVIAADLFMGVVALCFAAYCWLGNPPYWTACVVLGVRAVGNVFHTPAIQAIIPQLVPKEELVRANGWSQFFQSGAFMLGPVLGAVMYGFLPLPIILLTDFVGALIACATVWVVKIPELVREHVQAPHFLRELKEGIAVFRKDRRLSLLLGTAALSMIFFMPLSSLYPLMTSAYFQGTALQASVVELLYAVGMMGASFLMGLFGKVKDKLRLSYWGLLFVGVTSLLCGVLSASMLGFWLFAALCGLMGAGGNIYGIPCMAYMQESIAPEALGRAFSLLGSVMSLSMPVGLLISGPVAELYGVHRWFLITGVFVIVFVTVGLALYRKQKHALQKSQMQ